MESGRERRERRRKKQQESECSGQNGVGGEPVRQSWHHVVGWVVLPLAPPEVQRENPERTWKLGTGCVPRPRSHSGGWQGQDLNPGLTTLQNIPSLVL
jgi:hypothetical protein